VAVPVLTHLRSLPRQRLAERVTAASYGTVLVLASLVVIEPDEVGSGVGWELVTGVGVATWVAHLFAEVVGDHLRHSAALGRTEITRAMRDGFPILIATVLPAVMLLLGRLDVLAHRLALWASVAVAVVQLAGLGGFVGLAVSAHRESAWRFAGMTTMFGVTVVSVKVVLGH
jgi:hypothetical protein